jgi:esterase/lipase superfamily enzyme
LHKEYVENPHSPIRHIVLFTWPARSNILKYRDDARDAATSGYAFGRGIQKLRDFFKITFGLDPSNPSNPICNHKIHLLVHSMGAKVLESMFEQMLSENKTITSLFSQAILVGADVDYTSLESPRPLNHLIDICERVNVYYHNADMALKISETTKNAFNRLGKFGPRQSNLLPDDIVEVNTTNVTDDNGVLHGAVHHWYYYNSPTVINDISSVLNGNSFKDRSF